MDTSHKDEFSLNSVVKQLRQESRSVRNRLQSIIYDSEWVQEVQTAYERPLIPNERCGLWYVPPSRIAESCYFKSTDGHITQWSFCTRRLNFHIFDIILKHSGIIIVDSTRRGKLMPDALSKTIPIWCATLNYVMFGENEGNWLFLPGQIISDSERHDIVALIPQFAKDLLNLRVVSKEDLLEKFGGKYLRPLWVYPGMSLPFGKPDYDDFYPVINCVASVRAQDGEKNMAGGFTYVQGAADDHELWAEKLNPKLFWDNFEALSDLQLSDAQLLETIDTLEVKRTNSLLEGVVKVTDYLFMGKISGDLTLIDLKNYQTAIVLSKDFKIEGVEEHTSFLCYPLPSNKKGSNDLRKHLPEILKTIERQWPTKILVLCDSGIDLSVGVVLAILATRYNLDWQEQADLIVTKDVIKRHLARLLGVKKVNPSRATLQSINSILM